MPEMRGPALNGSDGEDDPRVELLALVRGAADALAFSSMLPAAVAASLVAAAAAALDIPTPWSAVGLAAAGTLVVYNVDRLRDVAFDRATAPLRSLFMVRHRRALHRLTLLAAIAGAGLALGLPPAGRWLCVGVLAVGLLHRRFKRHRFWKALYVTVAWVAITAGLPAIAAGRTPALPWLIAVYAASFGSNLVASSLRGQPWPHPSGARALGLASAMAAIGATLALLAPPGTRALVWVPAAQLVSLAAFRPGERYGLVVIDGALAVGALLSLGARQLG
jgi:4-hydroxybenzoate polyprenyltransferase